MVPYHTMIYGPCRMMVDNPMQEDRLVVPTSEAQWEGWSEAEGPKDNTAYDASILKNGETHWHGRAQREVCLGPFQRNAADQNYGIHLTQSAFLLLLRFGFSGKPRMMPAEIHRIFVYCREEWLQCRGIVLP